MAKIIVSDIVNGTVDPGRDDRQAQNFLVGVVDNNSSSGCKYRAVPLVVEK